MMEVSKTDGYVLLAFGFALWALSSYVSRVLKRTEKIVVGDLETFVEVSGYPFLGDIMFKGGTMLVIVGILIIFEVLLAHNKR